MDIIRTFSDTLAEFGGNDMASLKIFVNGEPFLDDVDDHITPADIWAFMVMVARKQIPADSVYFQQYKWIDEESEDDLRVEEYRINIMQDGRLDRELLGKWFHAADNMALEIFDLAE